MVQKYNILSKWPTKMRHFYGLQDNKIIDRAYALSNVFFTTTETTRLLFPISQLRPVSGRQQRQQEQQEERTQLRDVTRWHTTETTRLLLPRDCQMKTIMRHILHYVSLAEYARLTILAAKSAPEDEKSWQREILELTFQNTGFMLPRCRLHFPATQDWLSWLPT